MIDTRSTTIEATEKLASKLFLLAVFYVGFSAAPPQWGSVDLGGKSLALLVAIGLGFIGWRHGIGRSIDSRYERLAILLGAAIITSSIASWSKPSVIAAAKVDVWIAFIIPGLAVLFQQVRVRNALLTGWAAGATVYTVAAFTRWVEGRPILDRDFATHLLGVSRGAVNVVVLFIVPFVLGGAGGRLMRRVRWPLLALSVFWLINSGGRQALLGLVLIGLFYVLLQPNITQRVRLGTIGAFLVILIVALAQASGGSVVTSSNRLLNLVRGEETDSDSARATLLRKSIYLVEQHPFFGVGIGNFVSSSAPVSSNTKNRHVQLIVTTHDEHNTYTEAFEFGIPGFLLFMALLIYVFRRTWRTHGSPEGRVMVTALSALLVSLAFHSGIGSVLYIPLALGLGLAGEQQQAALEPAHAP